MIHLLNQLFDDYFMTEECSITVRIGGGGKVRQLMGGYTSTPIKKKKVMSLSWT